MMGDVLKFISAPQFILFCVVLSVVTIVHFLLKKRDKVGVRYGSSRDLASAKARARNLTRVLLVATIAVTVSLGLVLANVSSETVNTGECKNEDPNRRDTMIVVDISGSMIDTSGTNFKLVRSVLFRTLGANPEENIGLTFFSNSAFAPIAPTKCHAVFATLVHENLYKTKIFNDFVGGTDGASGIKVAQQLLLQSDAKTKRIVFIGDLQDGFTAGFIQAMKQAHKDGTEIQLIGIKANASFYQDYGFNVTAINDELDAEKLGPFPEKPENKKEIGFSSRLNTQQITIGWIVLFASMAVVALNFYVRRSFTLRRRK